ncbi:MAG: trigger factor, partial [Actinomycetota bacterium]|nr:trigger factor [Actinomycetota bacterium]
MKTDVEKLDPTRVKLSVEVPFSELKANLDSAYRAIGGQVRVPGFRPGKVPTRIIDARVGRGAVLEQAINEALPRLYGRAVEEAGVEAIGQPDVDITLIDDGKQLTFTAEVDIKPEFDLP